MKNNIYCTFTRSSETVADLYMRYTSPRCWIGNVRIRNACSQRTWISNPDIRVLLVLIPRGAFVSQHRLPTQSRELGSQQLRPTDLSLIGRVSSWIALGSYFGRWKETLKTPVYWDKERIILQNHRLCFGIGKG